VLGLGAVAPSLVAAFLKADRADVAPMLSVLAVMSLTRPLMWASAAYLQATDRPRILMVLEITTVTSMVVGLMTLGRISVIWACVAVGIATFVRVIVTAMVLKKIDGIGLWAFFKPQLMPVVACLPMTAAVVGVRHLLAGFHLPALASLVAEIGVGWVAYLAAAWVVANPTARDVLDLAKRAVKRRRA
jgi:PST family polysaccharide transporter